MSRKIPPPRQRFTVVFAQTVYHSTVVTAANEAEAESIAAERYGNDDRLFVPHALPRPWRRWWGDFHVEDATPASVTPAIVTLTKGDRS